MPSAASGRQAVQYDTTAIGRGLASFGNDVTKLAQTVQAGWDKKGGADAYSQYLAFKAGEDRGLVDQSTNIKPEDAQGFAARWNTESRDRGKALLDGIADPVTRQKLGDQMAQDFWTRSAGALKFEQAQQTNWFKGKIGDATTQLETNIRRNGSADFDTYVAQGDAFIVGSGLSPVDKDAQLKAWHAEAAKARTLGIASRDPQAALDELHAWLQPQQKGPATGGAGAAPIGGTVGDAVNGAASRAGIDPSAFKAYALIESSGDPNSNRNNKSPYKGLFNLSDDEFQKGGGGDIYNPVDNANAAANVLAGYVKEFRTKFGRDPAPVELYLIHQQGFGGAVAHLSNPSAPAWQNMLSTGEGKAKGAAWAKEAIWGNVPDDVKKQFPGGVETVTSADFIRIWGNKVAGFGGGASGALSSPLANLSPADIDKLTNVVQQQVDDQRMQDTRIAAKGREDIVKAGDDLMQNMPGQTAYDPAKPTLTLDWLQSNRENIAESDYRRFVTALTPGNDDTIKTPPQEMLRLDDLVQSDPKKAQTVLRDEYIAKTIARGTYDQLNGRAQSIINGDEKRPYVGQVRSYLANIVKPDANGSLNEFSKAFQTLSIYDEWAAGHKDAKQADVQGFADNLVRNQQVYVAQYRRDNLPLPTFITAPNRYLINEAMVNDAITRTANAKMGGTMSEQEASDQTNLLNQWLDVVKRTDKLPIGYGRP